MSETMNDSDFDDILRSARATSALPSSFRQGVWRRIENDTAKVRRSWFQDILTAVARPWGAAVGLAATVTLGLWLGAVTSPGEKQAQAAYANSISPFTQSDH